MLQKVDETNILASHAAVLPPVLRSNRTHHEEKPHLKTNKCTKPIYHTGNPYYIIDVSNSMDFFSSAE